MTPVLSLPSFTGNRNNIEIFLYNWRALYTGFVNSWYSQTSWYHPDEQRAGMPHRWTLQLLPAINWYWRPRGKWQATYSHGNYGSILFHFSDIGEFFKNSVAIETCWSVGPTSISFLLVFYSNYCSKMHHLWTIGQQLHLMPSNMVVGHNKQPVTD